MKTAQKQTLTLGMVMAAICVALGAYLLAWSYRSAQPVFSKLTLNTENIKGALATSDQCTDSQVSDANQKENSNKMLFVSCGGFLD